MGENMLRKSQSKVKVATSLETSFDTNNKNKNNNNYNSNNGMDNKVTTIRNNTKSKANNENVEDDEEEACVVCFKPSVIYSIGECDHPVCYECSTRMRVLCQQNECPICRQVLAKVIFAYEKLPYRELEAKNRSEFYNKKYKIGFYTSAIQQEFYRLLDHPCPKCNTHPYRTFQGLRNHVRKEHDLHYCDLCIENLKIFTFERRCYTSDELGLHRTKGDADNRSHRGHPLCKYCNKRFLDRDELFRHLRREHYFCHFCDADGCNEFYSDYDALADHFRQEHFLCESGKCATEQFVGAFRTEIDYKAHVANVHSESLNKQQAKQTRTLQLEITLGPRGRSGQPEANVRSRPANEEIFDDLPDISNQNPPRSINVDSRNEQDFPSLGGNNGTNVLLLRPPPMLHRRSEAGLARTKENFPALGGSANAAASLQRVPPQANVGKPISSVFKQKPAPSTSKTSAASTSNAKANPMALGPPLPPTTAFTNNTSFKPGMVLHVSNRPTAQQNIQNTNMKKPSLLDFPVLPNGKASSSNSKKGRSYLEEDLGTTNELQTFALNNVAAKHRTLVDEYVSVANPSNFQKLQTVQKEEMEKQARREHERKLAPKLTVHDFPSLGGKTSNDTAQSNGGWVKMTSDKKQRVVENRLNKVAAAPVLKKTTNVKATALTQNSPKNKKDKKQKEKQPITHVNKEKSQTDNYTAVVEPPPGFGSNSKNNHSNNNGSIQDNVKPPPGFLSNVTVKSVAKPINNLTFTSSLGESYSIVPQHAYVTPPDSMKRIQNLDKMFDSQSSPEAMSKFCELSCLFREGKLKANIYYDECRAVLGDKFDKVFPEFLALLPDINKQQDLYLRHKQHLNDISQNERKSLPALEVCPTCKQVLVIGDLDNHLQKH